MTSLETYNQQFSSLHTNVTKGRKAPHKAILLISIIKLIEDKKILTPQIFYDEVLEKAFSEIWNKYAERTKGFSPFVGTPFWHMNYEPFWTLVPRAAYVGQEDLLQSRMPGSYSKTIKDVVKFAEIDEELFNLLNDEASRNILKKTLIDNYLK